MRSASAAMVAHSSKQLAELDLHSKLFVQRAYRLRENERIEPQLEKAESPDRGFRAPIRKDQRTIDEGSLE